MCESIISSYLKRANDFHKKAEEEYNLAKSRKDEILLRDACAKAWLSVIEATNILLLKSGIEESNLPKTDRGRRFMVFKHADKELKLTYTHLRDVFHIEGYYEGTLTFEEMGEYLDNLKLYIEKVSNKKE
jgi:uncharacterized protein (UPF0332 family)